MATSKSLHSSDSSAMALKVASQDSFWVSLLRKTTHSSNSSNVKLKLSLHPYLSSSALGKRMPLELPIGISLTSRIRDDLFMRLASSVLLMKCSKYIQSCQCIYSRRLIALQSPVVPGLPRSPRPAAEPRSAAPTTALRTASFSLRKVRRRLLEERHRRTGRE